ncbi:hypothetical protein [Sedimentibacter sp. MB31-C6]|uniref:hypothetical protein n=1 Tax=Sedimentibacter sp. MB31-C6 TaxID=3109366 RepID=UPI002DDCEE45|nr:hypothetical protein [Sedimentibacter sp. MB36-C1]WSI03895.1 hypothetical protein U8307_12755 [Sedimentibacter sp. MB36-C1]
MENNKMLSWIFKGFSLLIIDVVTIKIVFSIWAILNISVFPMAICFIFLSLIILNIVIALSSRIIETYGMSLFITTLSSSVIYYLFSMVFTGIVYITITSKWYFIVMMLVTLFFFLLNVGYLNIRNNNKEKEYMTDIKLLMIHTNKSLEQNKDIIEENEYNNLKNSIERTFERINSSTPFGRISEINTIKKENEIIYNIEEVNSLLTDSSNVKDFNSIKKMFDNIYNMVYEREKLIIK